MKNGFERADKKVSVHEGGYSNHPSDPGGATFKGVIQRVYDAYRLEKNLAVRDVRQMTENERLEIYRTRYWNAIKADQLPPGIDYVVYDGAVNSGPVQSVKWLQRALGDRYAGKIDGMVGPATIKAASDHPNHDALVRATCDRRLAFLQALKTWSTFGKGWGRRVAEVRSVGQAWAMGDTGPDVHYVPGGAAKGLIEDAKPAPKKEIATGTAAGGAGVGGVTVAVERLQETITPYSAAGSKWIDTLVVILALTATILTVGGIAWRFWQQKKSKDRADALDIEVPA